MTSALRAATTLCATRISVCDNESRRAPREWRTGGRAAADAGDVTTLTAGDAVRPCRCPYDDGLTRVLLAEDDSAISEYGVGLGPFGVGPTPASATPAMAGEMVFQLTDNTTLVVKVKGSDGVVRSATLTLA